MRLQQRILVIILPLILLPTIMLGWFAYTYTQLTKNKLDNLQLEHAVSFKVYELHHVLDAMSRSVLHLAHDKDIVGALNGQQVEADIQRAFGNFKSLNGSTSYIALYNAQQQLVSQRNYNWSQSLPQLNELSSDSQAYWRLIQGQSKSSPAVLIQHKVVIDNMIGQLQIIIEPDIAKELKLQADDGSLFLITDLAGQVLFSYPAGEIGKTIPKQLTDKISHLNQESAAPSIRIGEHDIYFSSQPLAEQYVALFGQNRSSVVDNASSITWITLAIVMISISTAVILIYFSINRYVIAPITRLSRAKQNVAQGKLDVKLDVNSEDEFGQLFASFNVMVRQLIVYREKERDSRLRLEYKVKERTEELEATNTRLENFNIEIEQARQLSDQASAMKTAFVANMSHEIRTPLTAILGFTEQVIADGPKNKEQLDLLGRVLRSGKHLLALINNILDMSKIEANKLEVEVEQVDLFELFNDVISLLSIQAAEKELEFNFNYSFPLPRYVRTDPTRLRQVLLNLASNAIKFTEQGFVHIDVRFNEVNWKVEVTVSDSGIGMETEVADSLFQPFMQADASISRKFGGTGLGLVISKNLANLLGGDISVHSELGNGSEFVFNFDLVADNQAFELNLVESMLDLARDDLIPSKPEEVTPIVEETSETNSSIEGRVLVAEDVEDNQYLFKLLLDSIGVEHVIVENGEQAFEKAMTEDFDLILMDMQMPIMGGLEATSLLRQAGIDTPVYALTANVMKEDLNKHKEAGCDGTIAKPIEKESFLKTVINVIENNDTQTDVEIEIPAEKLAEMKAGYIDQLSEQKTLLSFYIETENQPLLKAELHKIKGSAGSYGFMSLSELASELEKHVLETEPEWLSIHRKANVLMQNIENIIHAEYRSA